MPKKREPTSAGSANGTRNRMSGKRKKKKVEGGEDNFKVGKKSKSKVTSCPQQSSASSSNSDINLCQNTINMEVENTIASLKIRKEVDFLLGRRELDKGDKVKKVNNNDILVKSEPVDELRGVELEVDENFKVFETILNDELVKVESDLQEVEPPTISFLDLITPAKYSSKEEWLSDMEKRMTNVVSEYAHVIGRDPKEYHLFYLTMYRFLEVGHIKGFILNKQEIEKLWNKYDEDASSIYQNLLKQHDGLISKIMVPLEKYQGPKSAFLLWYIRSRDMGDTKAYNGNNTMAEDKLKRNRKFNELDVILKDILSKGNEEELKDTTECSGLKCRLSFFRYCTDMTNPKDVCRMTNLWNKLISGLMTTKKSGGQMKKRKKSTNDGETDEDKIKRRRLHRFLYEQARRDKMSKEELQAWQQEKKKRRHEKYQKLTQEDKNIRNERYKRWRDSLTGEKRKKYDESVKKANLKYMRTKGKDNPERKAKFLEYLRKKLKQETPEERTRRLLRYKVNTQQRKARKIMEQEGKSQEEILQRMEEIRLELGYVALPPKQRGRKPGSKKVNNDRQALTSTPEESPETQNIVLPDIMEGPIILSAPPSMSIELPQSVVNGNEMHIQAEHVEENGSTLPRPLIFSIAAPSSHEGHAFPNAPTTLISLIPWNPTVAGLANANLNDFSQHTISFVQVEPAFANYVQDSLSPSASNDRYTGGADAEGPIIEEGSQICLPSNVVWTTVTTDTPADVQESTKEQEQEQPITAEAEAEAEVEKDDLPEDSEDHDEPTILDEAKSQSQPELIGKKNFGLGPHMCDECGATYCRIYELRCHKADVHKTTGIDFTCPECSYPGKSSSSLWYHYARYHLGPKSVEQYPQEVQNFFQKPPHVIQPRGPDKKKNRGEDLPNICDSCGKKFSQKASLDEHYRRVHLGLTYNCDICNRNHQSAGKLWKHKVESHGMQDLPPPEGLDLVYCKFCSEPVMRGYETHVRKKHPEKLDQFKNSKDNIKVGGQPRHKMKNHVNALNVLPESVQDIVRDIDGSNKDEDVQCPVCSQKVRRRLMKRHYLDKHYAEVPCPECGKVFGVHYKMMEHYWRQHAFDDVEGSLESKGHLKTYPYSNRNGTENSSSFVLAECLICKTEKFTVKPEIRAHFVKCHPEIIHELRRSSKKTASFKCENCSEKYVTELELRRHLEESHPEKKYVCDKCGVFKRTQKEVLAHERIHNDVSQTKRRGICPVCEEKMQGYYGDRDKRLREHVSTKHPEKYKTCEKCEFWTTDDDSLRYHVTQKHYVAEKGKNYVDQTLCKMNVLCRKCGRVVKMASLQEHLLTHGVKEESYQCCHCSASFKKLPNYVAHEEIVHGMPLDALVMLPTEEEEGFSLSTKPGLISPSSRKKAISAKERLSPNPRRQSKRRTKKEESSSSEDEMMNTRLRSRRKRRKVMSTDSKPDVDANANNFHAKEEIFIKTEPLYYDDS